MAPKLFIFVAIFVVAVSANQREERGGMFDSLAGAAGRLMAGAGDVFLPSSLMKAGCKEVGLNDRDKRGMFDQGAAAAGRLMAGFGDVFLPSALMKAGCKEVGLNDEPPARPNVGLPPVYIQDPPVYVQGGGYPSPYPYQG